MKERITTIIESLGFTSAQFAEQIGASRSILSHIQAGRNKPSLDIIVKILSTYKDISPDWLLMGEGEMLRSRTSSTKNTGKDSNVKIKSVDSITIYYADHTFEVFKRESE